MQKITSTVELKNVIRELEFKQTLEGQLLKEQFMVARERLTPSNVIKSTFTEVFTLPNLIKSVLTATVGVTSGYFAKKYFRGLPLTMLKKLIGIIS